MPRLTDDQSRGSRRHHGERPALLLVDQRNVWFPDVGGGRRMTRESAPIWASIIQVAAITLIALVAGSTFGIWLGYNPLFYSPSTFVEVHQGAVKGLNFLLPAIAMTAIVCVIILAYRVRRSGLPFYLYLLSSALIIGGGLITRFVNQPINADIMNWSTTSLPDGWQSVRNTWWTWHIVRTISSIAAMVALIIAVLQDRNRNQPRSD